MLVTAPAAWVHVGFKIDGHPGVGLAGEPDYFSWVTVGIGASGKVLTAHGLLPGELRRKVKPLLLIEDAIAEMNQSPGSSNADSGMHAKGRRGPGGYIATGPDLKRVTPKVHGHKIIGVGLAYQARSSRVGETYYGPVYVFSLVDTKGDRPNKITTTAVRMLSAYRIIQRP